MTVFGRGQRSEHVNAPRLLIAGLLGLAACTPKTEEPVPAAPKPADAKAAPESEPAPEPAPGAGLGPIQEGECPMDIVPGKSLGPVQLGMTRKQLEQTGFTLATSFEDTDTRTEFINAGPYRVAMCGGLVEEVWIEDLRLGPDCATHDGKPVARDIPRDDFVKLFSDCEQAPPRIGGAFYECHDGGIWIGHGLGEFIQVRVGRPGRDLDDDCSHVLDDGSHVPLEPAALAELVEKTVDSNELTDYWHVSEPGRRPLRIVGGDVLGAQPDFKKFGEPVEWITAEQAAADGKPFLEFTKLTTTATRATFEFRYDVEGIAGTVKYVKRHDSWQHDETSLAER